MEPIGEGTALGAFVDVTTGAVTPVRVTARAFRRLPSLVVAGVPPAVAARVGEVVRATVMERARIRYRVVVDVAHVNGAPLEAAHVDGLPAAASLEHTTAAAALGLPAAVAVARALGLEVVTDNERVWYGELYSIGDIFPLRGAIAVSEDPRCHGVIAPGAGAYTVAHIGDVVEGYPGRRLGLERRAIVRTATHLRVFAVVGSNHAARTARVMAAAIAPSAAVARAHDLAGLPIPDGAPLRAPHHAATVAAMESERRLAAGGVLYLERPHAMECQALAVALRGAREGRYVLVLQAPPGALDPDGSAVATWWAEFDAHARPSWVFSTPPLADEGAA